MSSDRKIVLVTGSNKGIGYGIIETLLEKKSHFRIILTSRKAFTHRSFHRTELPLPEPLRSLLKNSKPRSA